MGRFPGQYHDTETGLFYNVNRYYNPDTGRYITADPLGLAPSPNPHTYVANPTTAIDPLGLNAETHGLHEDATKGAPAAGKALELSRWPANDGFLHEPVETVLRAGTRVDRIGGDTGRFAADVGTPLRQRAMRPGSESGPYSVFELQQDVTVRGGITAPAFGQPGGGVQYLFPDSMSSLLESGAIRRVS